MDNFSEIISKATISEHFVFIINLITFFLSKKIIKTLSPSSDEKSINGKLWAMRAINLLLLGLYMLSLVVGYLFQKDDSTSTLLRNISQTGLTLLLGFIASQLFSFFAIKKYGKEKTIDDEVINTETYQSEIFSLLGTVLTIITLLFIIINIWDITEVLQVTGVIGGVAIVAFSTKEVWAPDNINGLILLYNGNIEPGSIVKVDELKLSAIVIKTTLTQTIMRDLSLRHEIVIPNSKFRNTKIEILNNTYAKGVVQYIEYNIGYEHSSDKIEALFKEIWDTIITQDIGINAEKEYKLSLVQTGDHAIRWRFTYTVEKIYKINDVRFAINRIAFDISAKNNIGLNTPITHTVDVRK